MTGDDDIAARLPDPPPPAPARRQAAIDAAMRRFDGAERAIAAPRPWREGFARPQLAALVTVALAALLGAPIAWLSLEHRAAPVTRESYASADHSMTAADLAAAPPAMKAVPATPSPAAAAEPQPPAPAAPVASAGKDRCEAAGCVAAGSAAAGRAKLALADAAPPAAVALPPPPPPPSAEAATSSADLSKDDIGMIAGAGNAPAAVMVGHGTPKTEAVQFSAAERRMPAAKPARRGDWNNCTVDDPAHSLTDCRPLIDPGTTGPSGRAAAHVEDGLSRAWQGDLDGAIAEFDRAIAIAPRLSIAYLNRGLAYRDKGQSDRALADLDRAVRYAPDAARGYFHRGQLLRQRGQTGRAEKDEDRAVAINPDYVAAVR